MNEVKRKCHRCGELKVQATPDGDQSHVLDQNPEPQYDSHEKRIFALLPICQDCLDKVEVPDEEEADDQEELSFDDDELYDDEE